MSVLPFPNAESDIADRKARQTSAYIDLENPIRDARHMAMIVNDIASDLGRDDDQEKRDRASWAIHKLCEMVLDLSDVYNSDEDCG